MREKEEDACGEGHGAVPQKAKKCQRHACMLRVSPSLVSLFLVSVWVGGMHF